jgi:flagellar hook-length control protein FliK
MAAAPNILEAAAVTPAVPAPTAGTPAAGFDAILMLQNLAASAATLEAAQFEAVDASAPLATDDTPDDEEEGEDLESSLAFLSALLNATTPLTATTPQKASNPSHDDFPAGAQTQSDSSADPAQPLTLDAKASFLPGGEGKDTKTDAQALIPVRPELLETRMSGDPAQNLARAADLLSQVQRSMAAAAPDTPVLTHARDPRWADDFSARVSLLVRAGESTASLQLTPVDLGPVEVSVTVKDSQATIHFGAAQADTRALIEASLPRLRELLASQGFNLMDASVSSGFSRSQQQSQASASGLRADETEAATSEARQVSRLGLLDTYA